MTHVVRTMASTPSTPCSFESTGNNLTGSGLGVSMTNFFMFCTAELVKKNDSPCHKMSQAVKSCHVRKFGCQQTRNSQEGIILHIILFTVVSYYIHTGPFNCPNWGQWNEWSECPYQHPCSENKTRHEQRKIRNCNKHDDCSIDCVGMTHNI